MTDFKISLPWIEKYRPKKLEDVVGNEESILRLRVISKDGNLPNLILSGTPGTGKTTSMHCLARELLKDAYNDGVLELNASDERSINVVRQTIKLFAQTKVTLPEGRHKIVILDEADSMTKPAQQALRRIMEIYSSTTRFCFACNTSSKIIEPIQSRCAIVRFRTLTHTDITECLQTIVEKEGIKSDKSGIEAICFCAEGDMRNAINTLQACHEGFDFISSENVFKVTDQPHPSLIRRIIDKCVDVQLTEAIKLLLYLTQNRGYSVEDMIVSFSRVIRNELEGDLDEYLQLMFIQQVGRVHVRICEGANSELQLTSLLARMCRIANDYKMAKKQSYQHNNKKKE